MNSWELVKDIVATALELDERRRATYAIERCAGDAELLAEVMRLLRSAGTDESFLEEGPIRAGVRNSRAFADGEIISGRFRILGWIGSGGMGEVYAAFDNVLDVTVALKTIRAGMDADDGLAGRLLKEVQLAREVTHSNVCRIHDLFRHRVVEPDRAEHEVQFLSMEYLSGETLAERLRRESIMTPAVAGPLLLQIVEGLTAAHRANVVHRDLKPGNVILVHGGAKGERAVITDFGLARSIRTDLSQASLTSMAGTPAYMAPEQLAGAPATFESDVYAFGVLSYQTLTGHHPRDSEDNAASRATDRQSDPLAGLDPLWKRVILRCLERDPTKRFPSAEYVLGQFYPDRAPKPRPTRRIPIGWLAAVALIVVFLSVALFFAASRFQRWKPRIPKGSAVLLTRIRVPDPELEGMTTVLRSQLAQSPRFVLTGDARVSDLLKQMGRKGSEMLDGVTAREVALRDGAPLVIYGSVSVLGQDYVLALKLEQVSGNPVFARNTWKSEFTAASKTELFGAVRRAANWVRLTAGEAARDLSEQDRRAEDTTTGSWHALQLYERARQLSEQKHDDDAVLVLREAIQLDPGFAAAHAKMADLLMRLKRYDEGYDAWRHALRVSEQKQLTSREHLRISGQYFEDTGDYRAAERVFRTFAVHYPDDYAPRFFLASVLENMGRMPEAATRFEEVCRRWPNEYPAAAHLAWLYLTQNKFAEADAVASSVRVLGQQEWARWLGALSFFARGRLQEALAAAEPLGNSTVQYWRSRSYLIRGSWLAELDRAADGIAQMEAGIRYDMAQGLRESAADKRLLLAQLHLRSKARAAAVSECVAALAVDNSARRAARAGMILARAGDLREARRIAAMLHEHADIPRLVALGQRLDGEIALAEGAPRKALTSFRAAAAMSPPWEWREQMARALAAAGDRKQSLAAYKEILDAPALFWPGPQTDAPALQHECRRAYRGLVDEVRLKEKR